MKKAKRRINLKKSSQIANLPILISVALLMGGTLIVGFGATYKILHPPSALDNESVTATTEEANNESSFLQTLSNILAFVLLCSVVSGAIAFTLINVNDQSQNPAKPTKPRPKSTVPPMGTTQKVLGDDDETDSLEPVRPESVHRLKKVAQQLHQIESQVIPIVPLPKIHKNSPLVDRIDLRREYPLSVLLVEGEKNLSPPRQDV